MQTQINHHIKYNDVPIKSVRASDRDSRTLADYVYKNIVRKNNMRFQQMKTVMLASDNKKTRQKMSQGLFK
jgi:hypothetical protein